MVCISLPIPRYNVVETKPSIQNKPKTRIVNWYWKVGGQPILALSCVTYKGHNLFHPLFSSLSTVHTWFRRINQAKQMHLGGTQGLQTKEVMEEVARPTNYMHLISLVADIVGELPHNWVWGGIVQLDSVKHLTKFGKLDDVVNGKAIYHVDLRNSKKSFSNALKPCLFFFSFFGEIKY
jgi:phosphoribosylformimino-5-aminoimidazole carboxamide ribonucleotide (ProFAR) isomerase